MAQADRDLTTSRRSFLGLLGRSAAIAAVTTVPAGALNGSVVTPTEYVAECDAIGYRIAAASYRGVPCGGYFESGFVDGVGAEEQRDRLLALQLRTRKQRNADWHSKMEIYLISLGRLEEVGPLAT